MKSNVLEGLNQEIKEYFTVLSKEFPRFLIPYIQTKQMQRIGKIGCACGTDYTKIFHHKFFYTNLEHSIATALIVWNFTKDKKQTLAALFHDIAVPVFKHAIDFMNGDYETQESTEALTTKLIEESQEIMTLLKKDGVKLEEVVDYHIYPIADNDTPKLSADRLEYTFSNGIYFKEVWDVPQIKRIYENIKILENEEGIPELGFQNKEIAEKFIKGASQLWPLWISNEDKLTMQFLADIVKEMSEKGWITVDDLYLLSEQEIIQKIKNCGDSRIEQAFHSFEEATKIGESKEEVKEKYCKSIKGKRRYIVPIVETKQGNKRINKISEQAKKQIEDFLQYETTPYAYFDFAF